MTATAMAQLSFGIVAQLRLDEEIDRSLTGAAVGLLARSGLPTTFAELDIAEIGDDRITSLTFRRRRAAPTRRATSSGQLRKVVLNSPRLRAALNLFHDFLLPLGRSAKLFPDGEGALHARFAGGAAG